jgi:PiT family inorganic phosphate transporter
MLETTIILVIGITLLFEISNGWNDSANAIATVVSTRVLTPMQAVLLAAFMNVAGAFFSTAVAKTIGKGIVNPSDITQMVVAAALLAGFLWNGAMTFFGLPVSASHALIGGVIGAGVAHLGGFDQLNLAGLTKIFVALFTSPVIGIFFGYMLMKILIKFFCNISPGTLNKHFGRLQVISASFMAFSHGSNDAQKGMGVIFSMGIGTAMGGWRVIKTLGHQMLKLQPVHGFAAETSATAIILGASSVGLPVSTTHVITTCIMGVGATKRLSAVRWGVARKIVLAWIFTLPMCIGLAWLAYKFFELLGYA